MQTILDFTLTACCDVLVAACMIAFAVRVAAQIVPFPGRLLMCSTPLRRTITALLGVAVCVFGIIVINSIDRNYSRTINRARYDLHTQARKVLWQAEVAERSLYRTKGEFSSRLIDLETVDPLFGKWMNRYGAEVKLQTGKLVSAVNIQVVLGTDWYTVSASLK
jgi:hypothetical protein